MTSTAIVTRRPGFGLGLLGVTMFALTLPMTRLATGTPETPQLDGLFIATGRAAAAALLSALFLWRVRAPWPRHADWPTLALVALGVVFGFPILTSLAMRDVGAVHASVIVGLLPLVTALVGAQLHRQRPSAGFWVCALAGTSGVVGFAWLRAGDSTGLHAADLLLVAAVLCAAVGYGHGARLATRMPAEHVICWALLLALPISLPLALWTWPSAPVQASAWGGLAYVTVFSMWLGFFAWYRGLALGGTVHVSQLQLLQPFLSMLFAVPLLGESLDALSLGFALAVSVTVFIGKNQPVRQGTPS